MEPADEKPRPARPLRQRIERQHAEQTTARREQQQRDDACPRVRYQSVVGLDAATITAPPPPASRRRRRPSRRTATSRAGSCSSSSHSGARSPSTIAAVLAVFASTHDAAATESPSATRRSRGRPCAGRRCDAARPPDSPSAARVSPRSPGRRPRSRRPARDLERRAWSSAIRTGQPPSGASPATAMSPPRMTSTPSAVARAPPGRARSAASAFAVAPRSSSTPFGASTVRRVRVELDRAPARAGRRGPERVFRRGRERRRSVASYPARRSVRRRSGRRVPRSPARRRAPSAARRRAAGRLRLLARRGVQPHELGVDAEAAAGVVDRVQLPREHGVSFSRASGSATATTAVVPSAGKLREAGAAFTSRRSRRLGAPTSEREPLPAARVRRTVKAPRMQGPTARGGNGGVVAADRVSGRGRRAAFFCGAWSSRRRLRTRRRVPLRPRSSAREPPQPR